MRVSVRELKNRLSEYLRRVENGEDVTVTRRGRVVAALVPARPVVDPEAASVARLRRLRWVRAGSGDRPRGADRPMVQRAGDPQLSEIVIEDRQ